MRYPFATFIVTAAIFACMFLLINTGELRLFADNSPQPMIAVANAQVICPSDGAEISNVQDFTNEVGALCNDKNACEINSKSLIGDNSSTTGELNNCTLELRVEYSCKMKSIYQAKILMAYLYEGQIATIKCASN